MASEGVVATLEEGWRALAQVDAPKAVIGGLAMTAWKHARYTRDADVLVAVDRHHVDDIIAALTAAGFRPRHEPPLRVIDGQGIVQFTFQPAGGLMPYQFDVLLASGDFQRQSIERAVSWPLPGDGGEVRVVRPDDLIVLKLLAGRIIDHADAAMVLRENRADLDFQRLHRAVADHGLSAAYRTVWREAFPDDAPPD